LCFKVIYDNFLSIIAYLSLAVLIVTFVETYKDIENEETEDKPVKYGESLVDKLSLYEILTECYNEGELDLHQIK